MPISYVRDDEQEILILTVTGEVTVADWLEAMMRQIRDGCWHWGTLYHAAFRTVSRNDARLHQIRDRLEALIAANGPRGPVAYVALDIADYGRSRRYSGMIQRLGIEYATFTDTDEAVQWLREHRVPAPSS